MNNLIKSFISFWLTCILILVIAFTILYNFGLQYEDWGTPIGSEVLANNLKVFLTFNLVVSIIVVLVCLGLIFFIRRIFKTPISISGSILGVIFIIFLSSYLNKSAASDTGEIILDIKDIVPLIILLSLSLMFLIFNQLIYLEKIKLGSFLKNIFVSYLPLSIGVLLIISFQIFNRDLDKYNRAWDNYLLVKDFFGRYTEMTCTLHSELKKGMGPNKKNTAMEYYYDLYAYETRKDYSVKLDKKDYYGKKLIKSIYVLYEPYDAVRYHFKRSNQAVINADYDIFKGKTQILFSMGETDQKYIYELEFNTQSNEMIIKSVHYLERINLDQYKIPEWKLSFYKNSLGESVSESIQDLRCKYN